MPATATPAVYRSFKAQAAHGEETGVRKDDVYKIPPESLLEEPGFNERDYNDPEVVAKIEEFAQAYANGQFVPHLVVRIDAGTGNFYIVEGHQRTRGAKLAISRGASVPYLVCVPFRGNDVDRYHCQLDSQAGLALKPVGVARLYLKLLNLGVTEEEIAARRHKELSHVQAMLVLAQAPAEVHRMVNSGQVGATLAIQVLREKGDGALSYLRAALEKEQAKGKTKIRPAALREWKPPPKIAGGIINSVQGMVNSLATKQRRELAELEKLSPSQLKGRKVEVDAAVLLEMVKIWGTAMDARAAKEQSSQVQKQRRSQQSIPGADT
ncbi:ParB/RepB/Spo0J family partition protein [Paracidovorax citrulli]|uniref:ParB/RepB/Spo0J family partition protein n=1 Tax=Paracidovorax citrulli TaxID=80869 RepID=UPI003FA764F7